MADSTGIENADARWNVLTGCSYKGKCRKRCWARSMARRVRAALGDKSGYPADDPFAPTFHADRLAAPLGWKKPQRVAVSFMGDMWSPEVSNEQIAAVFATMACCPQHEFMVLTKQLKRMERWFAWLDGGGHYGAYPRMDDSCRLISVPPPWGSIPEERPWPFPNVLVGTSVSTQEDADERLPWLMECPGRRWISVEPLLEQVDLRLKHLFHTQDFGESDPLAATLLHQGVEEGNTVVRCGIAQVVVGGESGPSARPMHPQWARSLRDQCKEAAVPFTFKQWGSWALKGSVAGPSTDFGVLGADGTWHPKTTGWNGRPEDGVEAYMVKVGKKRAGDVLDNARHHEPPRQT